MSGGQVERFMLLASAIPSYATRLRCAGIMQSFGADTDFTLARLETVDTVSYTHLTLPTKA